MLQPIFKVYNNSDIVRFNARMQMHCNAYPETIQNWVEIFQSR